MIEQTQSTEQLRNEIVSLRRRNRELAEQIACHKKVFREVHLALQSATAPAGRIRRQEALPQLTSENEQVQNQLKVFRLTEREKEVLRLIVAGCTSKEIADRLLISKLTVDTHRKHIQQKLEVSKIAEVIRIAMQSDLS